MALAAPGNEKEYLTVLALVERLPIEQRLHLISEVSARLSMELAGEKKKRGLGDLYGIWRGVVFDEDDFRRAEWTPPDDI